MTFSLSKILHQLLFSLAMKQTLNHQQLSIGNCIGGFIYLFFLIYLFILEVRVTEKERRKDTERNFILQINPQVATPAKAGPTQSQELHLALQHGQQSPKCLGHPLLLSQAHSRELDREWSRWDTNQCPYGCCHSRQQLYLLLHIAGAYIVSFSPPEITLYMPS